MTFLAHIADRVLGRPLLITPEKAQIVFDVLQGRIVPSALGDEREIEAAFREQPTAYRDSASRSWRTGERMPTYETRKGVAHIPIVGSLVNRGAYVGASSGLVSYEGIHTQITDALADEAVTSILLDINSPGGEAGGMFALARTIRDAAQQKTVVAFVNDMAASAAYGLASQASQIIVSPSSMVGSIGVVLMHLDRSGELASKGVKPTLIHAGAHKVDGNPFGPLPDGVRADLQGEVDKIYGLFLETVAEGRGRKLSAKAARSTEARVFMGQDAVDRGLADGMASFAEVLSALQKGRKVNFSATAAPKGGRSNMSTELEAAAPTPGITINVGTQPAATTDVAGAAPAAAAIPAAATPTTPVVAANPAPATTSDERSRIKAITTCEEASGRETLAQHLAFDTDMSVDAAKAILTASPKGSTDAKNYIQQKADAGTLGLSPVAPAPVDAAAAGWSKAIAEANKRFERV